ncbi:MAG: hypothetical protein KGM16_20010 [Bacteroidota bacterium]|nr:hypothetical protein [Bacteroidota bacterium]
MVQILKYCLITLFICATATCTAQSADSLRDAENIPAKFYSKVQKKYASIDNNLSKKSVKYLEKLQKQENRINKKLFSVDSLSGKANEGVTKKYESFIQGFKEKKSKLDKVNLNEYNSYIDTLSTSLNFLKKLGSNGKAALPLEKLNELKDKFNQSAKVNEFITERKQQIQQLLSKYTKLPRSITKQYDKLRKTAYYYKAQVNEYKSMLKDPKKIEETAINVLNKIPVFQKFMKKNSEIGSIFGVPGNFGAGANISGLQTRAAVQNLIRQRISSGGPNAMAEIKQNLAEAGKEVDKLKEKVNQLNSGGGDPAMPNFKPNDQKTKPFLKRVEYGFNIQFSKNNQWVPSSANLALSLGYKINNKSSAGIGISYSIGLGTLQHINISSQGLGLRSYLDWKIKGQIYASGGYEMNYNSAFKNIEELKNESAWQKSALAGISKKYRISKKLKGKIQLLYDFLAYRHTPVSQPFLFRVGYNF